LRIKTNNYIGND